MKISVDRRPLCRIACCLTVCMILSGCVQRRLTIASNPPGAVVKVDDVEIGRTPVSTGFTYYGTRKIQLAKAGYETLTVLQPVPAPWYQWPGIDFVSEHFAPGKVHDDRLFNYDLEPAQIVPTDQLLQRAEELRRQSDIPATVAPSVEPLPSPATPEIPTPQPVPGSRFPL